MRITLLTYGSRGDIQPFVGLALGLQRAGHAVRLVGPQQFADFAAEFGVPFVPLAGDPKEMSIRLNQARRNVLAAVKSMADYIFSIAGPVAQTAFAACEDADLIVHTFLFTTGAHSFARARGIPDVSIQTFPAFAPTRAFPNVISTPIPPGALSYFSHWITQQIFWHVGNSGYRKLRAARPDIFNLDLTWPFDGDRPLPTPLLFAYSPTLVPRPDDWTAPYIHITGFFFLEEAAAYQPPQDLSDFLDSGDAPVCVTFGSMVNREADRIDAIVRAALARTRQRAIVLTGWGGQEPPEHGDDIFYLPAAPHDWLLPRCKSVIHHGGAGTTAAGLRAGIPNIVIPHAADQPFWARRVAAIGAGPEPIGFRKLSVESLVDAFRQTDEAPVRARAGEVGRLIRAEQGVGEAIRLIERHAADFAGQRASPTRPGHTPPRLDEADVAWAGEKRA